MADFSAIRAAIATRLGGVTGLRVHTNVPEKVTCPAAFVAPENWQYHQTMGSSGLNQARFTVTVLAEPMDRAGFSRAQAKLDAYLDDTGAATSVKAAIEGDVTLGGTVSSLSVVGVREYGVLEWGGLTYVGAVIDVDLWA